MRATIAACGQSGHCLSHDLKDSSFSSPYLPLYNYVQECASPYEKAVYETITCLLSPNRDDDLAIHLHSKVSLNINFPLYKQINHFMSRLISDFPLVDSCWKIFQKIWCLWKELRFLPFTWVDPIFLYNLSSKYFLQTSNKILYTGCLRFLYWSLEKWKMLRMLQKRGLRSTRRIRGRNTLWDNHPKTNILYTDVHCVLVFIVLLATICSCAMYYNTSVVLRRQ